MPVLSTDEMIQELRHAGYRLTRQRLAIVGQMAGRPDHPSVKQIYSELNEAQPEISLATVYNTLNALVDLSLLREVEFEDADNRFDTNLSPHINIICLKCGNIVDYNVNLPLKPAKLARENGFKTVDCRMEYRGICHTCLTK